MLQRDLLDHAVSDVGAAQSPGYASAAVTAHGRSGLSETVLLMGSEESEFTQTTV